MIFLLFQCVSQVQIAWSGHRLIATLLRVDPDPQMGRLHHRCINVEELKKGAFREGFGCMYCMDTYISW